MNLTDLQKGIVNAEGHLLIQGGPGSGKTTISIVKAEKIISEKISHGQRILFLSFSNSAVTRVIEAIEELAVMTKEKRKLIDVETYHSFFWRIIKTHGYLLGLPRKLRILTPSAVAVALSSIRSGYDKNSTPEEKKQKDNQEYSEQKRIAFEEGLVSFDIFSVIVELLLQKSEKIRKLFCSAFPFILLDEFQDTNAGQWEIIKLLGSHSTLIALADPEQRIFDFIGANPKRLDHFINEFAPTEFNLGNENHRSNGTDITHFGNDILTGKFRSVPYIGIQVIKYGSNQNQAFNALKIQTIQACKRLLAANKRGWSVAILVPTKKLMRIVSDSFREPTPPAIIRHVAAIDMEGAILSAEIIAFLLQPMHCEHDRDQFVNLLCHFYQGKGGVVPTKTDLGESESLKKALQKIVSAENGSGKLPKTILTESLITYQEITAFRFSSNPDEDWISVRSALEKSKCKRLQKVALEARNIRILDRGTQLRDSLSENWRERGCYSRALDIVRQAFVQEHFSTSSKPETGVVIMNMHKAKGKQFDEVIIFEGWRKKIQGKIVSNSDRIVRMNSTSQDLSHPRQNLRVSVTRAKSRTTIMTSAEDPCILLP